MLFNPEREVRFLWQPAQKTICILQIWYTECGLPTGCFAWGCATVFIQKVPMLLLPKLYSSCWAAASH